MGGMGWDGMGWVRIGFRNNNLSFRVCKEGPIEKVARTVFQSGMYR